MITRIIAALFLQMGFFTSVEGSEPTYLENYHDLPVVVMINCVDCNPWDASVNPESFKSALFTAATYKWNMCFLKEKNEFGESATLESCGRGLVNIYNEFGQWGAWKYEGYSKAEEFTMSAELITYSLITK